jgi:hypothetical protein
MQLRALPSCVAVLAALVVAAACGGGSSPSSASGPGSVVVQGVVLGAAASGVASGELAASAAVKAGGGSITVTVKETGITTTVSANGTFELTGVPSGTFTLVFKKDGIDIGEVKVTAGDGSEVKITVQIQTTAAGTTLIVIEIKVENAASPSPSPSASACLISGGKVGSGIELEGNVDTGTADAFQMKVNGERSSGIVDVTASGASYKCNGDPKLSETECRKQLKAGSKVHVSGRLDTCDAAAAKVTASQVMIQK